MTVFRDMKQYFESEVLSNQIDRMKITDIHTNWSIIPKGGHCTMRQRRKQSKGHIQIGLVLLLSNAKTILI